MSGNQPSTHMFESKLRGNIRPVKVAYFVPDGDFETLAHVVRYACTQWGGMRNLIVPVVNGTTIHPMFKGLLKIHPPDLFVSYLPRSKDNADDFSTLVSNLQRLFPRREINPSYGPFFEKQDRGAHAISLLPDHVPGGVRLGPDGTPVGKHLTIHDFAEPAERS